MTETTKPGPDDYKKTTRVEEQLMRRYVHNSKLAKSAVWVFFQAVRRKQLTKKGLRGYGDVR